MAWSAERFGHLAPGLGTAVADAVEAAHEDALAAHAAGHMKAHDAYGNTMKVRAPELLVDIASSLDGVDVDRSDEGGRFPLALVAETSVALLPMRVGRDPSLGHESLRPHAPVYEVRRSLLSRTSNYSPQLSRAPDLGGDLVWQDPRGRTFDRVVVIAFGSSPTDGVSDLGWGDLELVNAMRGDVQWSYWERLERRVVRSRWADSEIDVDEEDD